MSAAVMITIDYVAATKIKLFRIFASYYIDTLIHKLNNDGI